MKSKNKLSLSKSNIGTIGTYMALLAFAVGMLTITAEVGAQPQAVRVNDRQVENIIRNIEQKSDTFRRSFDPALDRSRLDGTNSEDQINEYVKSFEDATNDLRSRFNGRTAVASDVENVLSRAAVIDRFMVTNLRQRQVQANWTSLKGDLNQLARAYNVTFNWSGRVLPPSTVAMQNAYRVNDRQVQTLLDRIESRGDAFRTNLDAALDRSRYNETNREQNVNEFAKDFENATDELRRKFDGRTSVDLDVSNVMVRAARIDDFMRRNLRRETVVQRDWRNLRADLNQLSSYYGLAYNLDNRRAMPAYSPVAFGPIVTGDERFTGTFRLDNARSENARLVAERLTSGLNANARTRIITNLSNRLAAPEMIAMQRQGMRVLLATSRSPQIILDADGQLRNERYPNGRPSNVRASFMGDSLSVVSNGDRANDFTATFTSMDGGRRMLVTRRVYVEQLREPVEVRSYYDRTAEFANFNIHSNPGYVNASYPNTFIVPRNVSLVAALDRSLSTETARDGDRFTMTVISPARYAGAVIEGRVSNPNRSGQITGRSSLVMQYETIRLNNQTYRFAGITETVRNVAGERVQIDNEGMVEDRSSQTNQTIGRTAVGAGVGALLGAIFGGGDGAAVGAAVGAGAGVGSVFIQGRDNLELRNGAEFTIRSTAPLS